jgi:exopolysaccharide production protein ExoZ
VQVGRVPEQQIFNSLQVGRGIAAVAVAAFHLSSNMEILGQGPVFSEWTEYGDLGVRFFFVLSGFIILQAHHQDIGRPELLVTYLKKRFCRIYPIYWVYMSLAIIGMLLVSSRNFQLDTLPDWLSTYALIKLTDTPPPIGPAWTLFHEMLFYILFALLIFNRRLGQVAFAGWFLLIAYFSGQWLNGNHAAVSVVFGAINVHFFAGMGAYWARPRLTRVTALVALSAGVCIAVFTASLGSDLNYHWSIVAVLWSVSFGMIISACCALEQLLQVRKMPGLLILLGDASYSVYLLHIHVQTYTLRIAMKLGITNSVPPAIIYPFVLVISVAAGCLAYQYLERPLFRLARKHIISDQLNKGEAENSMGREHTG